MTNPLLQYYQCPDRYIRFEIQGDLLPTVGYFRFGDDTVCYGRLSIGETSSQPDGDLENVLNHVTHKGGVTYLPFDPTEVINNLRLERYPVGSGKSHSLWKMIVEKLYYIARPILPVPVRKHLQKAWLMNWNIRKFPLWPVDHTVDSLARQLLLQALRSQQCERMPFIWFWPEGAPACAVITHDVETALGRDFCSDVMDIDDAHGIKSCFSIVPECRYEVSHAFLQSIKVRGFEVIIQDLNHDGRLYRKHDEYLRRVKKINAYGKEYGAKGFRSAVLYRNQDWFHHLDFSYDTSVPAVGHLEAQQGGCCTLMPYFIDNVLELPVTTTQDYALFHYLKDLSTTHWKNQTRIIMDQHGLINFIIHPDYIMKSREMSLYKDLLSHLDGLRQRTGLWIPTSGEVDSWWRQRAHMKLIESADGLRIEGEGSDKARVAFASEENGRLVFAIQK